MSKPITPAEYSPVSELISFYESCALERHAFWDTASTEDGMTALWHYAANLEQGITRHFVRWLATLISRLEDDTLRSLLAQQLHDELGCGDVLQAHTSLMATFLDALRQRVPASVQAIPLSAGLQLERRLHTLFLARRPEHALGGIIAGEVCARLVDRAFAQQVYRREGLPETALGWVKVHDHLADDHVVESVNLVERVRQLGVDEEYVWQGAQEIHAALREFLDGLHNAVLQGRSVGATQ